MKDTQIGQFRFNGFLHCANMFRLYWPCLLLQLLIQSVHSEVFHPYLASVEPCAVQIGEETTLKFNGLNLGKIHELRLYNNNLYPAIFKASDDGSSVTIHITPEHSISDSLHPFSLLTDNGITNCRYLAVTKLNTDKPKFQATENNPLSEPFMLSGACESANPNRIPFHLDSNVTYSFGVIAAGMGSKLKPVISIHSSDGKLIEESFLPPIIEEFKVSQSGKFHIQINDQAYDGGEEFKYILLLSPTRRLPEIWQYWCQIIQLPWNAAANSLSNGIHDLPQLIQNLQTNGLTLVDAKLQNDKWRHAPLIHLADEFNSNLKLHGESGHIIVTCRNSAPYQISIISNRLGLPNNYSIQIDELSRTEDGYEASKIFKHLQSADERPVYGKFHQIHSDPVGVVDLESDKIYGMTIKDWYQDVFNNKQRVCLLSLKPTRCIPGNFLIETAQPVQKDQNDRSLHPQQINLMPGQRLPIRYHSKNSNGVKFINLPSGISIYPTNTTINGIHDNLIGVIQCAIDSQAVCFDLQALYTQKNNCGHDEEHISLVQFSGGPTSAVKDWNTEISQYVINPSATIAVSNSWIWPIQSNLGVNSDTIQVSVTESDNKNVSIPLSIIRSSALPEEIIFRYFGGESKAPEIKFTGNMTSQEVVIDVKKIGWKKGIHSLMYYSGIKTKLMSGKGEESKEISIREYTNPVFVEIIE